MKQNNRFGAIDIAGFKLKYAIEDEGTPVLVIGSSLYYPRVFSSQIKEHLQFIFVDHKGFVPPPVNMLDNSVFDLDILIQDIETVRKYLGLENFIIAGHSGFQQPYYKNL